MVNGEMAKIIDFTMAARLIAAGNIPTQKKERTPEEVRKFMLGIEDEEEDQQINLTFIPLDERRTALVGDFAAIRPLIMKLDDIEECEHIQDSKQQDRGAGIILSVEQTLLLVDMIEEDGWEGLSPDVRRCAEARYNHLIDN